MATKVELIVRVDKEIMDFLQQKAKETNISLNNYIVNLFKEQMKNIPNEDTISAIEECRNTPLENKKLYTNSSDLIGDILNEDGDIVPIK